MTSRRPAFGGPVDSPIDADLSRLTEAAVEKVTEWLEETRRSGIRPPAAAKRLAAVLSHPRGLEFTVGFVDRVIRTEDTRAAATALKELGSIAPDTLSAADRAQISAGSKLGPLLPDVVVPAARSRMRSMVGHMVVDARDRPFGKAVAAIREHGHNLNINLLGEAVLGDDEADHHLEDARRLLRREDVDYVSIKVSSVASQLSMWGFEDTVDYVVERLIPMYQEAAEAPAGTKFINLDMEEYRDLHLTIAVFERLLSRPELTHLEAGIVLQAYLPDALGAMRRLAAFAADRVDAGGAGIKVRLVKGANLALEVAHAEVAGWPRAVCDSKEHSDANYKLVLHWLLEAERMKGVRLGVAGHNLFDIAFAHLLGAERGVGDRLEFEMLQGMAADQAEAVSGDVGRLLLYVPAVRPQEFDVAISYLVRRLEENASSENFMSGIFDLAPGSEVFEREADRFRSSVEDLEDRLRRDGHTPPPPQHGQDRPAEAEDPEGEPVELPTYPHGVPEFVNEPDTDVSLPANQQWARDIAARAADPAWLSRQPVPLNLEYDDVDDLVAVARDAGRRWAARPAAERAEILYRAADLMNARRGHLLTVAAAEAGKSLEQTDPEVSEAIDFARYYAHSALALEDVEHAEFTPDRVVLVTPPWNFPLAIPFGSTVSALAAGAAVIHKPSKPTPRCSTALLEILWEAGVPRDVLHGIYPDERDVGKKLVSHDGVDRVILTGASETAAMFRSWKPDLRINAETSGKNALVVTPAADRDLAVADLVKSAFGHAGQKCSAASLGIMVGSVYGSERFRRQLIDAASSLVVDWPTDLKASMGPLTELPSDKLHRALTTLEPGESWLLEPRQLDDTGRLWSPGIKEGVKPGSFFHKTEVFGPVLGLMSAKDLDEAIQLQNAVDFGLTGGIHSLDPEEVRTWVDRVEVGNAYVNRGITGAIVQRQSFGGWKQSSVGLGSKAGGPNYVMLFGRWSDDPQYSAPTVAPVDHPGVSALLEACEDSRDLAGHLDETARRRLRLAAADDERHWDAEFGRGIDRTGLEAEANIFRYRPEETLLRVAADARPADVVRALLAGLRAGTPLEVSVDPKADKAVDKVLKGASAALKGTAPLEVSKSAEKRFAAALRAGKLDRGVGRRVRIVGSASTTLREQLVDRPEVALLDDEVTTSGRVELRFWTKEQAVSMTLHRFGNPSPAFHALSEELQA
ncbi:MAG: bifunctional proline dehydrogenase/L-glutamate gamma-semialdehyde dehydrogenase [Nesterenkonia sp.]|nr:bifunctional proline dehydrogenase/L-glutamate gamma-semialdehyde dehydrogenase [Nesterenkonia sp.]